MSQVRWIAISRFGTHLFLKEFSDFLAFDVDGRKDYVAWSRAHQLDYSFPKVGLNRLNPKVFKVWNQMAFLREHRFALDKKGDTMAFQ